MSGVVYRERRGIDFNLLDESISEIPPLEQTDSVLSRSILMGAKLGLAQATDASSPTQLTAPNSGGQALPSKEALIDLLKTLSVDEWKSIPNLIQALHGPQ